VPVLAGTTHDLRDSSRSREFWVVISLLTLRGVSHMPDLVFIVLTVVAFVLVGLIAKGVERL
jgi:hypothetical protein